MAGRRNSGTTSKAGTRSTEGGRGTDVTLADHAGNVDPDLSRILVAFAGLATRIRRELPVRRDPAATKNVYGEQQLELDVWMNDLFVEALRGSTLVSQVASGEMGDVKTVGRGRFSVVLDPLDGSSNVKSNNIFGTIFGIFDGARLPARGSDLFAAGDLIYGPATTLVYAARGIAHEVIQGKGRRAEDFVLIQEGLGLPPQGKLYGGGGHRDRWMPEIKEIVGALGREVIEPR